MRQYAIQSNRELLENYFLTAWLFRAIFNPILLHLVGSLLSPLPVAYLLCDWFVYGSDTNGSLHATGLSVIT